MEIKHIQILIEPNILLKILNFKERETNLLNATQQLYDISLLCLGRVSKNCVKLTKQQKVALVNLNLELHEQLWCRVIEI